VGEGVSRRPWAIAGENGAYGRDGLPLRRKALAALNWFDFLRERLASDWPFGEKKRKHASGVVSD